EHGAGGNSENERVTDLSGRAGNGDFDGRSHALFLIQRRGAEQQDEMTNVEARNNDEIRMTKEAPRLFVIRSFAITSSFVLRHYVRPLFSSSSLINLIFRR